MKRERQRLLGQKTSPIHTHACPSAKSVPPPLDPTSLQTPAQREHTRTLAAVAEIVRVLNRPDPLPDKLDAIAEQVAIAVACPACAIFLIERGRNGVARVGSSGLTPDDALDSYHHISPLLQVKAQPGVAEQTSEMQLLWLPDAIDCDRVGAFDGATSGVTTGIMAVPLPSPDGVLGMLACYTTPGFVPQPVDTWLLHIIAEFLSNALTNAHLLEWTQEDLRRAETLRAVVEDISTELTLKPLLTRMIVKAVDLLRASGGAVLLFDESIGRARIAAVQSLPEEQVGLLIEPGAGLSGQVLARRQPVILDRYADLERPSPLGEHIWKLLATVGMPIWWRGQIIGTFVVFHNEPSRHFNEKDVELLSLFAKHAAIAIANARLHEQTEATRSWLETILEQTPEGVIIVETGTGKVLGANRVAVRLLDCPASSEKGHDLFGDSSRVQICWPDGTACIAADFAPNKSLRTGEIYTDEEMLIKRATGAHIPVLVNSAPLRDPGGRILGAVAQLHDVTRRKETERIKDQIIAMVSHEMLTPLTSIKGFAATLLRTDVEWDKIETEDFLGSIEREADRLTNLVENFLALSRLRAGRMNLAFGAVVLRAVAMQAIERALHTEEYHVTMELPSNLPLVWADPRRLEQVFANLIENAVKYSPTGSRITIGACIEAAHALITVADEGVGMLEEEMQRIFEPFYRADQIAVRQRPGVGLGLAICKQLIEAHGGRIWVESDGLGCGSRFRFTIPFAKDRKGA